MKFLISLAFIFTTFSVPADPRPKEPIEEFLNLVTHLKSLNIDWKVGDQVEYDVRVSFIRGNAVAFVREWAEEGPWVEINSQILGRHKSEVLLDRITGEVLRLIHDGEEQEVPDKNLVIEDQEDQRISVPAGVFDCVWTLFKHSESNGRSQVWESAAEVPMLGIVQAKIPTQYGQATIRLRSFRRASPDKGLMRPQQP